jgi:hypothetical protein
MITQTSGTAGVFEITQSNSSAMVTIQDITIRPGVANTGSAVAIEHTSSGGGASHDNLHMVRVQITPNPGGGEYFTKNVKITGQSGYNHFFQCRFVGRVGDGHAGSVGIELKGEMQLGTHIIDCNFGYFEKAIHVANNAQDINIAHCYIVNCTYGVYLKQNAVMVVITGCGFDTDESSIFSEGSGGYPADQIQALNNNFYFKSDAQELIAGLIVRSVFIGNVFLNSSSKSAVIGIRLTSGSNDNIVTGNIFYSNAGSYSAMVALDSGATNNIVKTNNSNVTLVISNSGGLTNNTTDFKWDGLKVRVYVNGTDIGGLTPS